MWRPICFCTTTDRISGSFDSLYRYSGSVLNTSEERQTPSETHAREDSELSLSVREVNAHTNTDVLQEQMAALKAQLEIFEAENRNLKPKTVCFDCVLQHRYHKIILQFG